MGRPSTGKNIFDIVAAILPTRDLFKRSQDTSLFLLQEPVTGVLFLICSNTGCKYLVD